MTSQIVAYVCLSRVKRLRSICIMQPFSTFLFALDHVAGPERLVLKLSGQIMEDQAIHEWSQLEDEAAEAEHAMGNGYARVPARGHVCIHAYTHVYACPLRRGNRLYQRAVSIAQAIHTHSLIHSNIYTFMCMHVFLGGALDCASGS